MKKLLMIVLAGLMTASIALAQGVPEKGQALTYPQLANLLVKALGLVDSIPPGATTQQQFDILMQNGIAPAGGWTMDEEAAVTKGDLARVLIQALEREDEVENPDDPQSWVDALAAMGISLNAASEALGSVDVLPNIVAQNIGFYSTDPLLADHDPSDGGIAIQQVITTAISQGEASRPSRRPPRPTEQ